MLLSISTLPPSPFLPFHSPPLSCPRPRPPALPHPPTPSLLSLSRPSFLSGTPVLVHRVHGQAQNSLHSPNRRTGAGGRGGGAGQGGDKGGGVRLQNWAARGVGTVGVKRNTSCFLGLRAQVRAVCVMCGVLRAAFVPAKV